MGRSPIGGKVLRTFANAAHNATTALVAAPGAGKRIKVVSIFVFNNHTDALTLTLKSATTAISSLKTVPEEGGFALPLNDEGWYVCTANEALNATVSSGGATLGIDVQYIVEQTS